MIVQASKMPDLNLERKLLASIAICFSTFIKFMNFHNKYELRLLLYLDICDDSGGIYVPLNEDGCNWGRRVL